MEATERPKCGSGKAAEEYDLPLHVGALFTTNGIRIFNRPMPAAFVHRAVSCYAWCGHGNGGATGQDLVHVGHGEFASPRDFDRSYVNSQSEMPVCHVMQEPERKKIENNTSQASDLGPGVDPAVYKKMYLSTSPFSKAVSCCIRYSLA
ncbi:hypothetical protein RJZ57_000938 [Blastomyces gilchristii]